MSEFRRHSKLVIPASRPRPERPPGKIDAYGVTEAAQRHLSPFIGDQFLSELPIERQKELLKNQQFLSALYTIGIDGEKGREILQNLLRHVGYHGRGGEYWEAERALGMMMQQGGFTSEEVAQELDNLRRARYGDDKSNYENSGDA